MAGRPGEFALINRHFRPLATDPAAFGLADDAAGLELPAGEMLVLTADMSVAGVHFFPDDPPDAIAAKALRVNLSDLAAKGAVPFAYLLSFGLPDAWTEDWVAAFAAGLARDQAAFGVALIGGDTVRAPGGTTVAITALGRVPVGARMVHRSGGRAGDALFVSGTIGDAALGLRLRQGAITASEGADFLLGRYLLPQPRVALAPAIRQHASAALDVSDGLLGDCGHLCAASGVTARIEAASLPLSPEAARLVTANPDLLEAVLTGGDDYEILAAVPDADAAAFGRAAAAAGIAVTRIGRLVDGDGPPEVIDAAGASLRVHGRSFDHFDN